MVGLLHTWGKYAHLLPRFDKWLGQRGNIGAFCCAGCGQVYSSTDDWRGKTELVETYNLIAGGKLWERRRCRCGSVRSLPTRGGSSASSRNT